MKVFVDTSSLLKLYHQENDSDTIQAVLSDGVTEIVLSEIAILEFRSAIWKKVREGSIDKDVAVEVISCFQGDFDNFRWIKLTTEVTESASHLLMKYGNTGLRTLDSIQLASALSFRGEESLFLTSDKLLNRFFREENLNVA